MNLAFRRRMVDLSHRLVDGFSFLAACWVAIFVTRWPDASFTEAALTAELRMLQVLALALALRASMGVQSLPRGAGRFEAFVSRAWIVARQTGLAAAVIAVAGVLVDAPLFDAKGLVAFMVSLFALRMGARMAHQRLLVRLRRRGRNLRSVLIVGSGPRASRVVREIERHPEYGYLIEGFIDDPHPFQELNEKQLGALADLPNVLHALRLDEVFVTLPMRSQYDNILSAVQRCEERGIPVHLPGDLFTLAVAHARPSMLAAAPMISILSSGPMDGVPYLVKRSFDRIAAGVAIVLLSPLMLAIALGIRITMGRPIFFKQSRVGYQRRIFPCFKFRTMVNDAEKRMAELERMNEMDGPVFKIKDDPRVTPFGAWLRRTSLDELPQLFNVLRGEMSLVGPRPLPLRDVSNFDDDALNRRFAVWPGITCTWQVSGRNEVSFEEWIALDLDYVDTWSLGQDLRILLQTVAAVLRGKGAY